MRASDQEREQTAERLRSAAGEGRLTVDELDQRLEQAYRATTLAELEVLTTDVPAATSPLPDNVRVAPGDGGDATLVGIMSGVRRSGHWRVGPRCRVVCVMGGADLDFNDAEFAAPVTELRMFCMMGGADLRVPDGLNVEISSVPIMGGVDVKLGERTPTPGGPTLTIRVVTVMGGVTVKRGRKRRWGGLRSSHPRIHP